MKMFRYPLPATRYPLPATGYRQPSLITILAITAAKGSVTCKLGISQVGAGTKPSRVKQRVKQQIGLNSPVARVVRQTVKMYFPSFLGLLGKKQ